MKYLLLLALAWSATAVARAATDLSQVPATSHGVRSAAKPLIDWIPRERHVLLVVDLRHVRAHAFLNGLVESGYPAQRVTLLLLHGRGEAMPSRAGLPAWPGVSVLVADAVQFRTAVPNGAVAQVFGLDGTGRVAWWRTGPARRSDGLVLEILQWVG